MNRKRSAEEARQHLQRETKGAARAVGSGPALLPLPLSLMRPMSAQPSYKLPDLLTFHKRSWKSRFLCEMPKNLKYGWGNTVAPVCGHTVTFIGTTYSSVARKLRTHCIHGPFPPPPWPLIDINNLIVMRKHRPRK